MDPEPLKVFRHTAHEFNPEVKWFYSLGNIEWKNNDLLSDDIFTSDILTILVLYRIVHRYISLISDSTFPPRSLIIVESFEYLTFPPYFIVIPHVRVYVWASLFFKKGVADLCLLDSLVEWNFVRDSHCSLSGCLHVTTCQPLFLCSESCVLHELSAYLSAFGQHSSCLSSYFPGTLCWRPLQGALLKCDLW